MPTGLGLRPGAKAPDEPPNPTGYAPPLDSTQLHRRAWDHPSRYLGTRTRTVRPRSWKGVRIRSNRENNLAMRRERSAAR